MKYNTIITNIGSKNGIHMLFNNANDMYASFISCNNLASDPYIISVLRSHCLTYHCILLQLGGSADAPHALVSSLNSNSSYEKNASLFSDLVAFVFYRRFLCKKSYVLCISIVVHYNWVDNIMS